MTLTMANEQRATSNASEWNEQETKPKLNALDNYFNDTSRTFSKAFEY